MDTQELLERAKINMERDGELLPIAFIEGGLDGEEQTVICALPDWGKSSDARKDTMARLGGTIGFGIDAKQITVMVDAYTKKADIGEENLEGSLADDPAATEAVIVITVTEEGDNKLLSLPYTRESDLEGLKIIWQEPGIPEGQIQPGSTFHAFFEAKKRITERMNKLIENFNPAAETNEKGETPIQTARRIAREAALNLVTPM